MNLFSPLDTQEKDLKQKNYKKDRIKKGSEKIQRSKGNTRMNCLMNKLGCLKNDNNNKKNQTQTQTLR